MIKKWNENIIIFRVILILTFIVMFIFNKYTYFVADDYSYMNSFFDSTKKIESVFDIFPSMYAHAFSINGRLVAHFFVQLFLLYSPWIFDIVNASIFVLFIFAIYRYCFWEKQINVLGLLGIFAVVWYFVPTFGQTMLWLDGSCNYLWAGTFSLWYLYPYVSLMKGRNVLKRSAQKILFILAGVPMGGYLETMSLGAICVAVMILIYLKFIRKKKIPHWTLYSIGTMVIGFVMMMFAPGTLKNKVASSGLVGYVNNFLNAMDMYINNLLWLLLVFVVLMVCAVAFEYKKNIFLAVIFFMASLITNFMHMAATYYPERNMLAATLFLIAAIMFLMEEFWESRYRVMIICSCWIMFVFSSVQFIHGGVDIYSTYVQCMNRNELIESEKAAGNMELELPVITASTKYSAKWGLSDLDTESKFAWSNVAMAKYYGVESMIGVIQ